MLVEGRIETTHLQEIFGWQVILGLGTAGEHRLLDQRITFETKLFSFSVEKRKEKRVWQRVENLLSRSQRKQNLKPLVRLWFPEPIHAISVLEG